MDNIESFKHLAEICRITGKSVNVSNDAIISLQEEIAWLEKKIERIYEIFEVPLEDDSKSCINMIEYYQSLWSSWQFNAKRKEILKSFSGHDNWYYIPVEINGETKLHWVWAGPHPIELATSVDGDIFPHPADAEPVPVIYQQKGE